MLGQGSQVPGQVPQLVPRPPHERAARPVDEAPRDVNIFIYNIVTFVYFSLLQQSALKCFVNRSHVNTQLFLPLQKQQLV